MPPEITTIARVSLLRSTALSLAIYAILFYAFVERPEFSGRYMIILPLLADEIRWIVLISIALYFSFYASILIYCVIFCERRVLYIKGGRLVFLHPAIFSTPLGDVRSVSIDHGSVGISWWGDVVIGLQNNKSRRIQCGLLTTSAVELKSALDGVIASNQSGA